MKFVYQFRTKENVPREGVINAANRDAAYSALRSQGIRPERVREAPGVFNKLFGKGKRWLAIGVLVLVACVLGGLALHWNGVVSDVQGGMMSPTDRHQIYGEPALMEELARCGYASVFPDLGDRFLALFAQPGVLVAVEGPDWFRKNGALLSSAPLGSVSINETDCREVRELKQIVLGMRVELREYLSNGIGTYESFVHRLVERQVRECQIYNQIKNELSNEKGREAYEQKNAVLRKIGLPTVLPPEG